MKVVCINNNPLIYGDKSSDNANEYLTVGKTYEASNSQSGISPVNSDGTYHLYIEVSDKGGFPHGHRWWISDRFIELGEYLSKNREEQLNKIL